VISWTPIDPFGAELHLDLAQPLSAQQIEELLDLFADQHLLLARGQSLSKQEQENVTGYFGPLLLGDDVVEVVSNDPKVGVFGTHKLAMHSDLAFCPEPVLVAALYATDTASGTSATKFASGARAYSELPESIREQIDGLEILNVFPVDQSRRNRTTDLKPDDPRTVHPLVFHDKRSGQAFLYLCEMQVDSVVGMPEDESEALLAQLFNFMLDPANIVAHQWSRGDIVIWDNLAVQHGRDAIPQVGPRTLRRTSAATATLHKQFPGRYRYDETGNLAGAMPGESGEFVNPGLGGAAAAHRE
jgi:alpha-ketoglutarate-dependent taurine dioxygenase